MEGLWKTQYLPLQVDHTEYNMFYFNLSLLQILSNPGDGGRNINHTSKGKGNSFEDLSASVNVEFYNTWWIGVYFGQASSSTSTATL